MNSFKKIALGMVAAMTLGTLVATPASADTVTVAVTTSVAGSGTALAPYTVNVPYDNVVSDTVTATEALTFTATVTAGTPVTFTTSGNAKIVSAVNAAVTSASGVTSLTVTPSGTTAVVYVFTTSTSASAVTASVLGASTTTYLKGIAGPAYNVSLSLPASGNISGTSTATIMVTDIFGNGKATAPTMSAINATAATPAADDLVVGKYTSVITLPATAGNVAVGASITAPTAVPTLAVAKTSDSALLAVSDLATALASANAALAAEKAASAAAAAKAATDAVTAKAAADKAVADAVAAEKAASAKALADAKVVSDKALADAAAAHAAELAKVKADNDAAIAAIKKAFNALAAKWNAKNPKAKVATLK